jgi:hypothetical protein
MNYTQTSTQSGCNRDNGYLAKYKHGTIRINPEEPDYSGIPKKEYDWMYTCYPGTKEEILLFMIPGNEKSVHVYGLGSE